jgi:hypothetical protein
MCSLELELVSVWIVWISVKLRIHARHVARSRCMDHRDEPAAIDLSRDAPLHVGLTPAMACL